MIIDVMHKERYDFSIKLHRKVNDKWLRQRSKKD